MSLFICADCRYQNVKSRSPYHPPCWRCEPMFGSCHSFSEWKQKTLWQRFLMWITDP